MLLPYRVKVSDTKVTHFTPILALCTCLYQSHLQKPVSMKQWHLFSGHGVYRRGIALAYSVNITLTHIYNYFTSRYDVMEQRGGSLWRMDV